MPVSNSSTRILDTLFEAAMGGAPWEVALKSLAKHCKSQVGSLIVVDKKGGHGSGYCIGVEEPWSQKFVEREARHVAIGAHFVKPGAVFTDRMAVPRRAFERSNFFQEWARPSGQTDYAGVAVLNTESQFAFVGMSRGPKRGAYDAEELRRFERMAPSLRHAAQIWIRLGGPAAPHRSLEAALDHLSHSVFLTNATGRILYANSAAATLLAEGDGLSSANGALEAATPAATAALLAQIQAAVNPQTDHFGRTVLRLPRPSGRASLAVLAAPLRSSDSVSSGQANVLLALIDPGRAWAPEAETLRAMFGLTPAESQLASLIVRGSGIKAAARTLGIAPATARTHLAHVFAKTGLHSQVQLAELAALTAWLKT